MLGHPCIRAKETGWQSDIQLCIMYMYMCDVPMLNVYGYGIYILEHNGVPLEI